MGHSRVEVTIHAIYGTKHRLPILPPALDAELTCVAVKELQNHGARLLAFGVGGDHAHLLFELGAMVPIAEVIGKQKSTTSRWLAEHVASWVGWQAGYAAFSVGRQHLPAAIAYVTRQRQRHGIADALTSD